MDPITQALTDRRSREAAARRRLVADRVELTARQTSLPPRLAAFVASSGRLFAAAGDVLTAGGPSGQAGGALLVTADAVAEAGRNAFRALASAEASQRTAADYSRVAAIYSDILCTLRAAWKKGGQVADFTELYGASNCSSTSGGSPPSIHANVNVLDKIMAVNQSGGSRLLLSERTISDVNALRADVLSLTGAAALLPRLLNVIASGLVVKDAVQ